MSAESTPTVANAVAEAIQNSKVGKVLQGRKQNFTNILLIINGLYALVFGALPTYDAPMVMSPEMSVATILLGAQGLAGRAGLNRQVKDLKNGTTE